MCFRDVDGRIVGMTDVEGTVTEIRILYVMDSGDNVVASGYPASLEALKNRYRSGLRTGRLRIVGEPI